MSGFACDWLRLRESADVAARNPGVLAAAAAHLRHRLSISVCDIGAGTGSALRALAPMFPARQNWLLVDHDAALVDAARTALSDWADEVISEGEMLVVEKQGKHITVDFLEVDLATDPAPWRVDTDLVTASAFFDLASRGWMEHFVARLTADGVPLLAMLSYDGTAVLEPPHAGDAAMLGAFNRHQSGDKGLGPAAGPQAGALLGQLLAARGWRVDRGESPWRLASDDAALMRELLKGWSAAVIEEGSVPPEAVAAWTKDRERIAGVRIGHEDLFARLR